MIDNEVQSELLLYPDINYSLLLMIFVSVFRGRFCCVLSFCIKHDHFDGIIMDTGIDTFLLLLVF